MQTDSKKIAIYLTNKCNLKCKHCFIEGNPSNEDFLSQKQIEITLDYFKTHGFGHVEFTGGESCLSPFLVPSIEYAKKLNYSVGVNTNGINIFLLKKLSPLMVDKITFSLDGGTAKTHDFLRGTGTYNRCLATIKEAISQGFRTEAIFTVHRLNIQEISKAVSLLNRIGVSKLSFNFISNQGTATLNRDLLLPPEAWVKAKRKISRAAVGKKIILRYPVLFATKKEFAEINKNRDYFCRILDPVKTDVYPDGSIYHCCLVTDFKNLSAGKVTDNGVVMDDSGEKAFVEKYKHLSCPVHQVRELYASGSSLIPVCLYYKTITNQG